MNIVINDDFSSITTSEDELYECILSSYNPESLQPFSSKDEVRAYVSKFTASNQFAWILKTSDEEKLAKAEQQSTLENIARAKTELQASDWSDLPSVRNTTIAPHLVNTQAFDSYRAQLRAIVVNKPATVETWPECPSAEWSAA